MKKIPENTELLSEIIYTEQKRNPEKKSIFSWKKKEKTPEPKREIKEALFRTADGGYIHMKETQISEEEARIWMENYNQNEAWIKCFGLPLNMK